MSFAYLPLYTGDYLRDTRALTPLEHGVFLMLLMYCWDCRGPLPLDEQDCAGLANCRSNTEIDALRKVLRKFFIRMDDGFYNKRIQREIEKSVTISNKRSEAGKMGYQAKAKQLPSKSQALASKAIPDYSIPDQTKTQNPTMSGKHRKTAIELLDFLNKRTFRNFRPVPANLKLIEARLKQGYTIEQCRAVIARKARDWSTDPKMADYLRPATLFNDTKFNQYVADVPDAEETHADMP